MKMEEETRSERASGGDGRVASRLRVLKVPRYCASISALPRCIVLVTHFCPYVSLSSVAKFFGYVDCELYLLTCILEVKAKRRLCLVP